MKSARWQRVAARRSAWVIACGGLLTGLFCAAAIAETPTDTKTALRQFGLTGTFSEDCSAAQRDAASERFELPPVGDPTVVSRVKDRISHMVITRVRSAGENRVVIEGSLKEDGATYEITLERSGNQIRIWRGVRNPDGSTPTTMIDEAMVPGTAVSIAWEQRCEPTELGQRAR
jgi:hypothetical protein